MQHTTPSVSERTKQGVEARDWSWVEASIWTERMVSALGNGVKGGCWYSLMDKVERPGTLWRAWQHVRKRKGAAGVDKVSVERFEQNCERYLQEIEADLKAGTYQPHPVKRVEIPKGDGKTRPLGIPVVKDRVVQTALKFVIEPIFEAQFLDTSYGFRPKRGCKDALRMVNEHLKAGYTWVVDADLQSYFDTIPHDALLAKVRRQISDGRILSLIEAFLDQDILDGVKRWTPVSGTPQGAVISPLLANLYLHDLDQLLADQGYRMVRYADDFVVLCQSQVAADKARDRIAEWTRAQGLTIHPEKTHVDDCRQKGQGFDFLGYRFEAGQRWVRKKSLKSFKDRLRKATRRARGRSLAFVIAELNSMLRGWFGYFKHAHRWTFTSLDGFIRRRLRAMLRRQQKRPGQGHNYEDHQRWPNAFFAAAGLFALNTAHQHARHSR
jgi:RNA-directed DNA polymerase